MRQITCPICNFSPQTSPDSFSRIVCHACGHQWTYLPEEVNSPELYRDEIYAVVDNRQSIFEKIIFSEARKILRKSKNLKPTAHTLLDFGSGKGQFLAQAALQGWKGIGVETEPSRADFAREKYRVQVVDSYYESGKIGFGSYDLITLNHVLEHLPKPMQVLKELLGQNLAADGLVYIEVPRSDSWQAKIAGENWMHWDIPKHLGHWNRKSLLIQMNQIGYQAVGTRSYSIHLGVLGMLQAILSRLGFRENLILRLKRKKSLGLLVLLGITIPFAWILELLSLAFGKSGILGVYFSKNDY